MVNRLLHHFKPLSPLLSLLERAMFNGHCILCGGGSQRNIDLCEACEIELPWLNQQCQRCALPLHSSLNNVRAGLINQTSICGQCLLFPPLFDRALAIWAYDPPIAQLISAFKYQRRYSYGRVLCELAAKKIISTHLQHSKPDLLVATPLHWRRQLKRGFNQSEHIARFLSQQLEIPIFGGVKRIRSTQPQQSLHADQRNTNIEGAFMVNRDQVLRGRCVAIIDDVVTTGATVTELARGLYNAGVKEVHIWCLARTPNL